MNGFFKDKNNITMIKILTFSGIFISSFVMMVKDFERVKQVLLTFLKVLMPFIWGFLFALILVDMAAKIEKLLPEKMKLSTRRFLGALASVLILILIIVVMFSLLVPKLVNSIASIINILKAYTSNPKSIPFDIKLLHLSQEAYELIMSNVTNILTSMLDSVKNFLPNLVSATMNTVNGLLNFVIGLIVCLYVLTDRRKMAIGLRRVALALLSEKSYEKGRKILYLSLEKFTKFFSGKLLDSLIIGLLCFFAMLFINLEYATLVAVIIGLTNIIPYFGPIIGAVPCTALLLFVDPFDALIFLIMVIILQQIDGNIIGPRILGDSVGLSSIWIMFAILVGGAYFGFFGMLLGVPVFSVVYYVIKEYVDERLIEKGIE
ncbi:MAG: AI-2E family transporter [Erysipelotrichaceae bacterium]|nr:AI-2E family transporter [Erysipelotrichaceae bacterium]